MVSDEVIRQTMKDMSARHLYLINDEKLKSQYESYLFFGLKAALLGEDSEFASYRKNAEVDIMSSLEQNSTVLNMLDAVIKIRTKRLSE